MNKAKNCQRDWLVAKLFACFYGSKQKNAENDKALAFIYTKY